MIRSSGSRNAPTRFLILALVAVLFALSFRATQGVGTDLFHPSLWGEDGVVFLNEANELGFASVAKPYAGYLHLIPRLAAYVTSFMPLEYAPLLFHLAWLSVFIAFICIAHSRLAALSVPAAYLVWALVLLAVQPQAGEVFYTLTNIQWFAGLALIVYLIFPFTRPVRIWQIGLVCVAGLTGPFSILATPILALRVLIFKDLRANWPLYFSVLVCAAIQAGFLLSSPAVFSGKATTVEAGAWLSAVIKFLGFGNAYPLATLSAVAFWAGMPWHRIFRAAVDRFNVGSVNEKQAPEICALIMVVVALGMIAIAFLRDDPRSMGPVIQPNGAAGGSRYYLIPYSLLILAAVVSTIRDFPRAMIVMGALSVICVANFVRPERVDFQWHAYSRLSRVVPGQVIPIAPLVETDPGWFVNARKQYSEGARPRQDVFIPLENVVVGNGTAHRVNGSTVLRAASDKFQITFPVAGCRDGESIGLEVVGQRAFAGWIQVLWARGDTFDDKNSVLRYYPPGGFKGYFAFDLEKGQDTIRVRPGFASADVEVSAIRLLCLM